jgi:hypothetical protein
MGKGGGSPQPSSQTVTQTNLPEYARPYFENLLQRTQAESYRDYTPYQGQRIAGFTPGQQQVQSEVAGMQTPGQFQPATQMTSAAGVGAAGLGMAGARLGAGAVGTGQQALGYGTQAGQFGGRGAAMGQQAAGAGQQYAQMATDPSQMQSYMSPYMQNVVEQQKSEAIRDAQKQQLGASLGAARQGTYGGARQLLAQTERERNLGSQLAQIQAAGSQKGFEAAQQAQQFGANLGLQGLQTGMQGQQLGIEGARAGMQGVNQALQGYQTGLQGVQTGLQGLQQLGQSGAQLGQLGTQEQAANLQRLQAQAASAGEQRALDQQRMDMSYADFLRQRDYPQEQLGFYSSILRGLPIQMGSTQTAYAQPPSMLQQVGGLGLSALGLYNLGR